MAVVLKPEELRVLGGLIEKSLAQPAYYPMTLNALTAACNQKTNREPVMQLAETEVASALHGLQQWQLAGQAGPDRGSRVNRFEHQAEQRFGWNAPQRALMAELILRGPQTLGELRSRASRMTRLEAIDYAREVLAELERADPPMVVKLPRQPGRSTTRFAHLLGGDVPTDTAIAPSEAVSPTTPPPSPGPTPELETLTQRVDALEQEVTALRAGLEELRHNLGA
jgi:hypothetical protein